MAWGPSFQGTVFPGKLVTAKAGGGDCSQPGRSKWASWKDYSCGLPLSGLSPKLAGRANQSPRSKRVCILHCSPIPVCSESWTETTAGQSWCVLLSWLWKFFLENFRAGAALPHRDTPYPAVYTCCKCLSPFSFAGLLSDPLLLPDCSFSFSKAVAYANVSWGESHMWEEKVREQHPQGQLPFIRPLEVLGASRAGPSWQPPEHPSASVARGGQTTNPHCFSSRQTICKWHINLASRHENPIISSAVSHFQPNLSSLKNILKILPEGVQATQNQTRQPSPEQKSFAERFFLLMFH